MFSMANPWEAVNDIMNVYQIDWCFVCEAEGNNSGMHD